MSRRAFFHAFPILERFIIQIRHITLSKSIWRVCSAFSIIALPSTHIMVTGPGRDIFPWRWQSRCSSVQIEWPFKMPCLNWLMVKIAIKSVDNSTNCLAVLTSAMARLHATFPAAFIALMLFILRYHQINLKHFSIDLKLQCFYLVWLTLLQSPLLSCWLLAHYQDKWWRDCSLDGR